MYGHGREELSCLAAALEPGETLVEPGECSVELGEAPVEPGMRQRLQGSCLAPVALVWLRIWFAGCSYPALCSVLRHESLYICSL